MARSKVSVLVLALAALALAACTNPTGPTNSAPRPNAEQLNGSGI